MNSTNRTTSKRARAREGTAWIGLITADERLIELAVVVAAAAAMEVSILESPGGLRESEHQGRPPVAWIVGRDWAEGGRGAPGSGGAGGGWAGTREGSGGSVAPEGHLSHGFSGAWAGRPVFLAVDGAFSSSDWVAAERIGATDVVALPEGGPWLSGRLTSLLSRSAPGRVVGVLSGSGGSGCTTLTALLGFTLASRGESVLVAEASPFSTGLVDALAAETAQGIHWGDLLRVRGALNPVEFAKALPSVDGLSLLAHRRLGADFPDAESAASVLRSARGAFAVTILDIGTGWSRSSLTAECDSHLVVVTPSKRGIESARGLLHVTGLGNAHVVLGARRRGLVGPGAQRVAQLVGVKALWAFPYRRDIALAEDRGALAALAGEQHVARIAEEVVLHGASREGAR